jgi:hypothetical protein
MPSSAAARTLHLPSRSRIDWVDLLLLVREIGCAGAMGGILPNKGVRGCFDWLECSDPKLVKDVELLNPAFNKLESILTGEGGLNDLDLSPSAVTRMDLRIFV